MTGCCVIVRCWAQCRGARFDRRCVPCVELMKSWAVQRSLPACSGDTIIEGLEGNICSPRYYRPVNQQQPSMSTDIAVRSTTTHRIFLSFDAVFCFSSCPSSTGLSGCVAGRLAAGHVAHAGHGWGGDVDILRRASDPWEHYSCLCECPPP